MPKGPFLFPWLSRTQELSEWEEDIANRYGKAVVRKLKEKGIEEGHFNNDLPPEVLCKISNECGFRCELAGSRWLGMPWPWHDVSVAGQRPKSVDLIDRIDVRSRKDDFGEETIFSVYEWDRDDAIMLFVVNSEPGLYLMAGWDLASTCKVPENWQEAGWKPPGCPNHKGIKQAAYQIYQKDTFDPGILQLLAFDWWNSARFKDEHRILSEYDEIFTRASLACYTFEHQRGGKPVDDR